MIYRTADRGAGFCSHVICQVDGIVCLFVYFHQKYYTILIEHSFSVVGAVMVQYHYLYLDYNQGWFSLLSKPGAGRWCDLNAVIT